MGHRFQYIFGLTFTCLLLSGTTFAQASSDAKPENLGPNVNSEYPELNPKISPDGKTLFFIRGDSPDNLGYEVKKDDQDVWYSELKSDGTWSKAKNIGKPINNTNYNAVSSISPDGNTILLSNKYYKDGTLGSGASISHRTEDGWSFPEPIEIKEFKNKSDYVDFYLTNDGKELLMAIQDENSLGERDIYVSFINADNSWSKPMNLGEDINTIEKDASPFLASDGVTLYFASEGHEGYGSRDIFVSRRLDDTWKHWSKPENMGPNINTDDFDAYYSISAKGDYAYFVSAKNSLGADDIFRLPLQKALQPKPVILVSGHVYNQKTKLPIGANILYEILPEAKEAGVALSNEHDGSYKIVLPAGKNYGFRADTKGFYSINENLDASAITEYQEITKDLYLAPIEINQTIRLNNIFFETAKSDLRSESFAELDRVVTFLKGNSNVQIEIKGHTDNVGGDVYNMTLSGNRAKSVMNYIVSKGIDAGRITSKGYGKTMPETSNDTEDGRQLNRRVEFTIVKS